VCGAVDDFSGVYWWQRGDKESKRGTLIIQKASLLKAVKLLFKSLLLLYDEATQAMHH
jgi:hypothetical protein